MTQEALLATLRAGDSHGPATAEVVKRLITLLQNTDLRIHWTSAGFSLKLLDPSGSGTSLVLGGVNRLKIFYASPSTLAEQLTRSGWIQDSVESIKSAAIAFLDKFKAQRTLAGEQFNIDLVTLKGSEESFIEGLNQVVREIQREAGHEPV